MAVTGLGVDVVDSEVLLFGEPDTGDDPEALFSTADSPNENSFLVFSRRRLDSAKNSLS